MANIRTRPETGKLFIDFRIHGTRYREQTLLEDNPKNRKQLEAFTQRMEAKILLGDFNYAEFFPNSPNIAKFATTGSNIHSAVENAATKVESPNFEIFARQWQTEKKIEWRASHACLASTILAGRRQL